MLNPSLKNLAFVKLYEKIVSLQNWNVLFLAYITSSHKFPIDSPFVSEIDLVSDLLVVFKSIIGSDYFELASGNLSTSSIQIRYR